MSDFKSKFWSDLEADLGDPEFKSAFTLASARIELIDQLVNKLDVSRVEQNLTKADLARMLKMQPANVRRFFSDQTPNPTAATFFEVALALGFELKLAPMPKAKRNKLQSALATQSA
jgi:DNA-binding phage protein